MKHSKARTQIWWSKRRLYPHISLIWIYVPSCSTSTLKNTRRISGKALDQGKESNLENLAEERKMSGRASRVGAQANSPNKRLSPNWLLKTVQIFRISTGEHPWEGTAMLYIWLLTPKKLRWYRTKLRNLWSRLSMSHPMFNPNLML